MTIRRKLFFRLDALCDAGLALFLLSSSWDGLYEFLGLPVPKPAFYAQLLGAALVALAIVEWTIAGRPGAREVAGGVAVGSGLGAAIIAVWLVAGRVNADVHGEVILWFVAAFLALEAAVHARAWLRLPYGSGDAGRPGGDGGLTGGSGGSGGSSGTSATPGNGGS